MPQSPSESPRRCWARFTGHVQGVGFRQTTVLIARGFDVTGYVRNEADGSVEVLMEGKPSEIHGLLEGVNERMAGRIRHCQLAWSGATGEFVGFEVRS